LHAIMHRDMSARMMHLTQPLMKPLLHAPQANLVTNGRISTVYRHKSPQPMQDFGIYIYKNKLSSRHTRRAFACLACACACLVRVNLSSCPIKTCMLTYARVRAAHVRAATGALTARVPEAPCLAAWLPVRPRAPHPRRPRDLVGYQNHPVFLRLSPESARPRPDMRSTSELRYTCSL
jgi:hypothetical protein